MFVSRPPYEYGLTAALIAAISVVAIGWRLHRSGWRIVTVPRLRTLALLVMVLLPATIVYFLRWGWRSSPGRSLDAAMLLTAALLPASVLYLHRLRWKFSLGRLCIIMAIVAAGCLWLRNDALMLLYGHIGVDWPTAAGVLLISAAVTWAVTR